MFQVYLSGIPGHCADTGIGISYSAAIFRKETCLMDCTPV